MIDVSGVQFATIMTSIHWNKFFIHSIGPSVFGCKSKKQLSIMNYELWIKNYCWNELLCGFEGNKYGIKTVWDTDINYELWIKNYELLLEWIIVGMN